MSRLLSLSSVVAVLVGLWASGGLTTTTLYSNSFDAQTSWAVNALPSNTPGLVDAGYIAPPHSADCAYRVGSGKLIAGCSVMNNPGPGIPGNIHTLLGNPGFSASDSNGVPISFTSADPIITFDIDMAYFHNVNATSSAQQAKFFNTDVNDARLGWGFWAVVSPNSPVNVCLGITANKIIAFIDGFSQESSTDTSAGFGFIGLKEIADYSAGTPVNIKVRIDKVNRTGTYLVNNVPVYVVDLAGKLPANDMTIGMKTATTTRSRVSSLEGWSISWLPILSHMDLAAVGSAKKRNTAGGLLDQQVVPLLFGLPQDYPTTFGKPYNSWVDNFAFRTTYLTSIDSLRVTSDTQ